jgi:hypothetical protein
MTSLVADASCFIRSKIKRSMSDGNIMCENKVPASNCNVGENNTELLQMQQLVDIREASDSAPEISVCEPNPCSRCVNPCTKLSTGKLQLFHEFHYELTLMSTIMS